MHCSAWGSEFKFDWSDARRLLFQLDSFAEDAKEWWSGPPQESRDGPLHRVRQLINSIGRRRGAAEERRPHLARAYGLATVLLAALEKETQRKHDSDEEGLPPPTAAFEKDMLNFQTELEYAQGRFTRAAQRTAQSRYWQGTMTGALLLAVITAIGGVAFSMTGTAAAYGIAVPAGAIGAMVSVLQRMTSGKLKLDFEAGRDLLEVFGAVRPFIGAVFGLAVMALLLGGFVPAVEVPPGEKLAFFAALGFLAGFNERWAQDMLNIAANNVGPGGKGSAVDRAA